MPWQNQSGGNPWGSNNNNGNAKGPWGQGGQSGQGGGDDFVSELVKQWRKKSGGQGGLPGSGQRGLLVPVVIAVSIAAWLISGLYRVQPGELGVELVFGSLWEISEPGLHYNYPYPIGEVETPQVELSRRADIGFRTFDFAGSRSDTQQEVPEESLILTRDENIVDMDFTVFWKIKDAQAYLFHIRDPEGTVKAVAESAMREVIGQTRFDQAVTVGREAIEVQSADLIQSILDSYESGIQVERVVLQQSDPPREVIDAFNDVQRARQDRDRLRNEAEAYANSILPEARGEAERILRAAEASREELIRRAQGEAQRFLSVFEAYQLAPEVTRKRMYLESIGDVIGRSNKIILEEDGGSGVVPYLPLPEIAKRAQQ